MTREFGFIKYSFCLILSMFFVTSGYAQESSTKDDSIQEVAFSTSWWHEHVSHQVALRDLRLWGKDEYRYSGKVKIGDFACKVNFSKKLQYVLRYQNAYFFICQDYFVRSAFFDFYVLSPISSESQVRELRVSEVPLPILQYQFPSAKRHFLSHYETAILSELLNDQDYSLMISLFQYYITNSREYIVTRNSFHIYFLTYLHYAIEKDKFSDDEKWKLFGILAKILWNDQKLEPVPLRTRTVGWVSDALLLLNRQEATDVIKAIIKRAHEDSNFYTNVENRSSALSRLEYNASYRNNENNGKSFPLQHSIGGATTGGDGGYGDEE